MTDEQTVITIDNDNWITIIHTINKHLRTFLQSDTIDNVPINSNATYIHEWKSLYCNILDDYNDNPTIGYHKVIPYMFGEPSTLLDFAQEAIRMVPPIGLLIHPKRTTTRGTINLHLDECDNEIRIDMEKLHRQYDTSTSTMVGKSNPSDIEHEEISKTPSSLGMTTELKTQVQELEQRLDLATAELRRDLGGKMDNLQGNITTSISDVVQKVINDTLAVKQTMILDMKTTITEGDRITEKLTGDIKRATKEIENLQNKTNSIATSTTMTTDKAIKEYIAAKTDLQEETRKVNAVLQNSQDEMFNALEDRFNEKFNMQESNFPTSSDNEHTRSYKSYPDEYVISGTNITIRTKKYQEDKTTIACDTSDELLTMYTLLVQVSRQYGIYITPSEKLYLWNISQNNIPPTFPLVVKDFENLQKYHDAYLTMSLSLATKLRESVKFHSKFVAAKIAITSYNNDGYTMLYHLIKNVHPRLQRNKATKPKLPKFEGNINQYILRLKNWIVYQENRDQPHYYDPDEIADDFLSAIKMSPWESKLKKGIEYVETKMDRWKNLDDDTEFPTELSLAFIAHTFMTPYIEANINPFEVSNPYQARNIQERGRPAVRAYYPRNRSRSTSQRQRSTSRDSSARGRSSSNPPTRRNCNICGGQHNETTVGCPHLFRQVHIEDYMKNTDTNVIDRQVETMRRERRARSQSRDSQRGSRSSSRSSHSRA
jgi:hypothetical protein